MAKTVLNIRISEELMSRLRRISDGSSPHISVTAIVEYCLERGLGEFYRDAEIIDLGEKEKKRSWLCL